MRIKKKKLILEVNVETMSKLMSAQLRGYQALCSRCDLVYTFWKIRGKMSAHAPELTMSTL